MRNWIVEVLTPVLCAVLVFFGLLGLGRWARARLAAQTTSTVAFADFDCQPPPGQSREAFLGEVQYLGGLPDRLPALDSDLAGQLAAAFARHPWVAEVRRVEVSRQSERPARRWRTRVQLIYRQPVLAVCPTRGVETVNRLRAVDEHGVLLPVSAVQAGLPVLEADVLPPAGPPGTPWGDSRVRSAALTANFLRPHLDRLRLTDCRIELVDGEQLLRTPEVCVVWGRAPGREVAGEAPAELKLQRLLDYHTRHAGLDGLEHDVRLLRHNGHFPLLTTARR
jgi:hypothetical protein